MPPPSSSSTRSTPSEPRGRESGVVGVECPEGCGLALLVERWSRRERWLGMVRGSKTSGRRERKIVRKLKG